MYDETMYFYLACKGKEQEGSAVERNSYMLFFKVHG